MQALVYEGPGRKRLEQRPRPEIVQPTDAIVKVTYTTICGTDLHIIKGDVPDCGPSTTLGHEGVGIVAQVGSAVTGLRPGDHVLISCITACGHCEFCRKAMYSHCSDGGWLLGHRIDGTQAQYVRVPHAEMSLHRIAPGADEEALVMLSDILPTGFECGVLNGRIVPGASVAIVGAGPIGLAALSTARFYSPASIVLIDYDEARLAMARRFGATATVTAGERAVADALVLTGGRGFDTVIEAVGVPAAFELCEELVGPGGTIANIGVHGEKCNLHLERLWSHNITITTRLVDTVTIPQLMLAVQSGRLDAARLITHRYSLARIEAAYDTFAGAVESHALKVIIEVASD